MPKAKTFHSKKDFAYETLRENILNGVLEPGMRLVIDDLAQELGVSPIPIREALQQLQHDGFVTIEPYVGASVTEIHAELLEEVFALLEATEIISSRVACRRMSEKDFAEMEQILRRMDASVADLDRWSEENMQLHQFICEQAGMTLVQNVMQQVSVHWNRLRHHYLEDVFAGRVEAAQRDHWLLYEALRTRNPKHVAEVIRNHNQQALAGYLDYLKRNGQLESVNGGQQSVGQ